MERKLHPQLYKSYIKNTYHGDPTAMKRNDEEEEVVCNKWE